MAIEDRHVRVVTKQYLFIALLFISIQFCDCQSSTPQNLETFYPFPAPPPSPEGGSVEPPPSPKIPFHSPVKHSHKKLVIKVVVATAATTLVVSVLFFFLIQRWLQGRQGNKHRVEEFSVRRYSQPRSGLSDRFSRLGSRVKGLIIDENGLDVVYWKGLGEGRSGNGEILVRNAKANGVQHDRFTKAPSFSQTKTEPIQEVPLLRGKSSTSHLHVVGQERESNSPDSCPDGTDGSMFTFRRGQDRTALGQSTLPLVQSTVVRPPLPPQPLSVPIVTSLGGKEVAQPPPPPPPVLAIHATAEKSVPEQPPPPPPPVPPAPPKRSHATPPPPPVKSGGLGASSNRNVELKGKQLASGDENEEGNGGQVKLKPLHWDKINKNTDHSMVWDKVNSGSFRFDNNLMEALFGYVAANRKSPRSEEDLTKTKNSKSPAQIMILEPKKSQNTAIVIKSLSMSRNEIHACLRDGHGMELEVLEKLVRIAPSEEEESQIMEFQGDPKKLAHADSFLYHLLKALPSAFSRIRALHFRSNYAIEVQQFKECLEILETACKELKSRGLFMKMLEAVLKAGNKMNAGTSRGNAQAFKLSSLRKLSDVKSTDGKTTLLHFVVEEVVRFEGKKLVLMRNRKGSPSDHSDSMAENPLPREGRNRDYKIMGLPVVGGLSSELSNVKDAAKIDMNAFSGTLPALETGLKTTKQLLFSADSGERGGFIMEMNSFLEAAEEEVMGLKEEGKRVMDMVKRTGEYYQQGASDDSKSNQLQLFVIVTDFLSMVDKVCMDISRKLQQGKITTATGSRTPTRNQSTKPTARFPNLPLHFLDEKSTSSSSESD